MLKIHLNLILAVDCPSEETVFDTSVEMAFNLNGSTDKTSEPLRRSLLCLCLRTTWHTVVMKTYGCDSLFCELSEASLTKVLTDGMNEERFTVTASGTCCGCTDVTSLFDLMVANCLRVVARRMLAHNLSMISVVVFKCGPNDVYRMLPATVQLAV